MREKALHYYKQGYNCSQCLLKAAEQFYGISVHRNGVDMCAGISNGFGIGGMCSVLIAGIMIFGLMFDKDTVKSMRLRLITDFNEKYKGLDCSFLKNNRKQGRMCEEIVGDIAEMVEKIITENV